MSFWDSYEDYSFEEEDGEEDEYYDIGDYEGFLSEWEQIREFGIEHNLDDFTLEMLFYQLAEHQLHPSGGGSRSGGGLNLREEFMELTRREVLDQIDIEDDDGENDDNSDHDNTENRKGDTEDDVKIEPEMMEAMKNQDKGRPLCRFFIMNQHCKFGDACSFSHTIPEGMSKQEAMKLIPCTFYQKGNCRYGEFCKFSHQDHEFTNYNQENHVTSHQDGVLSTKDYTKAVGDRSSVFTCGICFEDITRSGKRFGLLSNCSHCFCIDCLRTWRKTNHANNTNNVVSNFINQHQENARTCPQCRQTSDFVVPSGKFCVGEEKQKVIAAYKQHLSQSPCKYFNGTLGSCPFGRDCFYAHKGPDGEDLKSMDDVTIKQSQQQQLQRRQLRRRRRGGQRGRRHPFEPHWLERDIPEEFMDPFLFFMSLSGWDYERVRDI